MFKYSCKDVAEDILDSVKEFTKHEEVKFHIISNGSPEGERYIRNKIKVANSVNIDVEVHTFDSNGPELFDKVKSCVASINDSMIIQMPFFNTKFENDNLIACIPEGLDADGLQKKPTVYPATAYGISEFLRINELIDGKHIVVIGRSDLVGRPLTELLLPTDATVTMCHSKTPNLNDIIYTADVIVCAVGKRNFITKNLINKDKEVHIVDVGINFDEHGKLCGDVSKDVASNNCFVTPVPGGVGLLTTAALMENVVDIYAGI